MRFIRRFLTICLLLALIGGVWAGVYAQKRGFSKTWRQLVEAEFAKRGYFIDIGKLTLGPFQGLVAEDLQFYQDPERKQELAFIDNVILDLDLSQVLRRDLSVNTLDVQDASLALPLIPGKRDSEKLIIEQFSGRLVVTESQIEVVTASAVLHGIEVTMKGSLHRPPQTPRKPAKEVDQEVVAAQKATLRKMRRRLDLVQEVLNEIDKIEFDPKKPPRVELAFSGDLAELTDLRASARMSAGNLSRGRYKAEKLSIWMELDGEKDHLALKELRIKDSDGDLRLQGEWPIGGNEMKFDLETDANISELLTSIFPNRKLGEVVFYRPPRLKVEGTIYLDEIQTVQFPVLPVSVFGEFDCERLTSRGTVFDGLSFQFGIARDKYQVRNLNLDHKSGVLLANFMHDPSVKNAEERFRYLAEAKLDPNVFKPFLPEASKRFLERLGFDENSAIYLFSAGGGKELSPKTWKNEGIIDVRNFSYNGVAFDQIESAFEISGAMQTFKEVKLVRPEGQATANELYRDGESKMWTFKPMKSTIKIADALSAFCPSVADSFNPYRFTKSPEIELRGLIDGRSKEEVGEGERRHQFEIQFLSDQPAAYNFLGQDLPLDEPSGILSVRGDGVELKNFRAGLFEGTLTVSFEAENLKKSKDYRASVTLDKVPFGRIAGLYSDYKSTEGNLSGNMDFTGTIKQLASVDGRGHAEIENGDVFAIPMLGPLSKLVSEVIPTKKAGYSVATEASASFRIKDGILRTDDFHAKAKTFQFEGAGMVNCLNQTIDFDAKVNTKFAPTRLLLSPISKLLEFSCEGPISDPNWHPKILPKGLKLPDLQKLLPGRENVRDGR